jgi:hypothetical protein
MAQNDGVAPLGGNLRQCARYSAVNAGKRPGERSCTALRPASSHHNCYDRLGRGVVDDWIQCDRVSFGPVCARSPVRPYSSRRFRRAHIRHERERSADPSRCHVGAVRRLSHAFCLSCSPARRSYCVHRGAVYFDHHNANGPISIPTASSTNTANHPEGGSHSLCFKSQKPRWFARISSSGKFSWMRSRLRSHSQDFSGWREAIMERNLREGLRYLFGTTACLLGGRSRRKYLSMNCSCLGLIGSAHSMTSESCRP